LLGKYSTTWVTCLAHFTSVWFSGRI
jgi:hypothetical protein